MSALLLASWVLSCGWFDEAPPPAPAPVPPPVAPVEVAPAAAPAAAEVAWPLWRYGPVPVGKTAILPAGATLRDLDLDPQGRWALLVTDEGSGPRAWAWAFEGDPAPLKLDVPGRRVHELQSSPIRDEVFAITSSAQGTDWAVERLRVAGDTLQRVAGVWSSDAPLADLVAPAVLYEPYTVEPLADRVFVARQLAPEAWQVVSVRADGLRAYEVTSPGGARSEVTDPALRALAVADFGPATQAQPSARPLGVDPFTGELLWRDGQGAVHGLAWSTWGETTAEMGNWGQDRVRARGGDWRVTPNGSFRLAWAKGVAGVRLLDRDGAELAPLAVLQRFAAPPALSHDGRTLVGLVDAGGGSLQVQTTSAEHPLLAMRHLDQSGVTAEERAALLARGLVVAPTQLDQLYRAYEEFLYAPAEEGGPPVFASIDGSLEVLYAGFEAVFLRVEQEVALPRLRELLVAMQAVGQARGLARLQGVGEVGLRVLQGDYDHPEGARMLAEAPARSELLEREVDYGDLHPRGPYAARRALTHYFRAFKLVNLLVLTPEEKAALEADPAAMQAWRAWTEAQRAMVYPSRQVAALGAPAGLPAYVDPTCVPDDVQRAPPRLFPLSWGLDSEILQGTVQHLTDDEARALAAGRSWADIDADPALAHTPRACTVRGRLRPSGLDLLVGLGATAPRAWMGAELAAHPDLGEAHTRLAARFGGAVDDRTLAGSWLRLVQLLATERAVPEGVDPDLWHARLAETALASWTSFRYTTVLVQETTAAEAGGGGEGFERLVLEPGRGIVDPVPAAWSALSTSLQRLAQHGATASVDDRLVEVLGEAAAHAADMGLMAARQQAGEPLSREEYERILRYAQAIEHPFLLLKSSVPEDGALSGPAAMPRIVDLHTWTDEAGALQVWHAAVGHPQRILVLGGDRGVLVPARGAVYAWYERVASTRLDDAAWLAEVAQAPRPDWVVAARP